MPLNQRRVSPPFLTIAILVGVVNAFLANVVNAAAAGRDPYAQPFSSRSLWNTSLGRNARWSRPDEPDTRDLRHDGPTINAGQWSMPYFLSPRRGRTMVFRDFDRVKPVELQRLTVPPDIHPALPKDGDRHIIIFDAARRHMLHYFGCRRAAADAFDCALAQKDDTCGEGLGDYGWGTGVIRRWELQAGRIDHMLRFSLPVTSTRSGTTHPGGVAWPATGEDSFGPERYKGKVLFGSTIGLPADVDIDKLGLSPPGRLLAKTLQDYGALMRDTGGDNGLILYAEEAAEGMPALDAMRADLAKITPHLAILRNQAPQTPNGGGARRRPPLPPVDPKVCRG